MREIKKQIEIVTEEREVVIEESACCNKCGKKFIKDDGNKYWWDAQLHGFSVGGGYGSRWDGGDFSFDLCENCIEELVRTFKIYPNGFMDTGYAFAENDDKQKIFENWKQTGEWEELMNCTYEELVQATGLIHTDYVNEMIKKYHPDKPLLPEGYMYDCGYDEEFCCDTELELTEEQREYMVKGENFISQYEDKIK